MATGSVTVRLRPLRLAFIVNPTDMQGVLQAIGINTFLWGGMYNPILPAIRRIPQRWRDRFLGGKKGTDIFRGYIDAFDPDYLVKIGEIPEEFLKGQDRETISVSEILDSVRDDGTPRYGVGLLEIMRAFFQSELRFVRRGNPLEVILPQISTRHTLFLSAVFGYLPDVPQQVLLTYMGDELGHTSPNVSIANYLDFLAPGKLFLRRLSCYELRSWPRGWWDSREIILLLDATKPIDVIDYWNLRAMGGRVYPVAIQVSRSEKLRQQLREVIEENYQVHPQNPQLWSYTSIVPTSSITQEDIKTFIGGLNIPSPSGPSTSPKVIMSRYPPIWDEWSRQQRGVGAAQVEAQTIDYDFSEFQTSVNIRTLPPKWMDQYGGHGTPRYANEIHIRSYGSTEILAEVIPQGPATLARSLGGYEFSNWRFSENGLVYLSEYKDWRISFSPPRAESLFSEWLGTKGWQVSLSPAGRIAPQMLKQLGGFWGINRIVSKGAIHLLDMLSQDETLGMNEFWAEICKITSSEKYVKDPQRILRSFTDANMFQLGLRVQCPTCTQRSWYSVKDADYELRCPKCLEMFSLPAHSPQEIEWAYRALGPFSLPKKSFGVYAVLLTLRLFTTGMGGLHGMATPMLSFEAKKNGRTMEADLGLLFRGEGIKDFGMQTVFCECKTHWQFEKRDIRRMAMVAEEFPGAIIVFSTLNDDLSAKERALIRPFATRGRRGWKSDRPVNPVLVLTSRELLSEWRLETSWKEAGGKYASTAQSIGPVPSLIELCDATQRLYLDMEPLHEWRWKRASRKAAARHQRLTKPIGAEDQPGNR